MIREAKNLGDNLCVIIANDIQAENKRKPVFMTAEERKVLMENIKGVDFAVISIDTDTDVCQTLKMIKPDIFASGCDETHPDAIKEKEVCDELGIKTYYNVGGEKINSSSIILKNYVSSI
jgi:glycerol-3-phosphate cytidylyltransferase-like family protein